MRLFVALNFPAPVRSRIREATGDLRSEDLPIRWVDAEQLHVTLKFIGEVPDARAAELSAALERAVAGHAPLTVRLGSLGAFPSLRAPRVVWLGVESGVESAVGSEPGSDRASGDDLGALQERVETELERLGVERERRKFHPHVTLGRTRRRLRPPEAEVLRRAAEAGLEAACRDEHRVETIELMRSRLGRGGARYSPVSSHALIGGTR